MSVVQGGCGLPCLAGPVYDYICTEKCTGIQVPMNEVPDGQLHFVLSKVCVLHLLSELLSHKLMFGFHVTLHHGAY